MSDQLSIDQQNFLLSLARKTIEKREKEIWLTSEEIEKLPNLFKEKRGCFVTLQKKSNLRGCIGYILPIAPLYQAVIENAYNAAFSDPRFPPVNPEEIHDLHIEISVLTVPQVLEYTDKDDLLTKINAGSDGIILRKGFQNATFLPQVWDQLPDKEKFLSHLAMKAGLAPDEWEKGELEVEIYHALFFEEPTG
ncbi:MAG: AmmeMemoRadiSam system protein A [Spirochaetes bacterium]|nr:AmmeMemoRadiSam system protein A [Spirochaetota bacterium]